MSGFCYFFFFFFSLFSFFFVGNEYPDIILNERLLQRWTVCRTMWSEWKTESECFVVVRNVVKFKRNIMYHDGYKDVEVEEFRSQLLIYLKWPESRRWRWKSGHTKNGHGLRKHTRHLSCSHWFKPRPMRS